MKKLIAAAIALFASAAGAADFGPQGQYFSPTVSYNWTASQTFSAINGIQPNFIVLDSSAASANVSAGGTGYTSGNLVTVAGGTCSVSPILSVGASGGVVGSFYISTRGKCSVPPSNPVSVTGGSGSGATFNLSWGNAGTVDGFAPITGTGVPNGIVIVGPRSGENSQGGMLGLTAFGPGTSGTGMNNIDGMGGGTGMTSAAAENTCIGYFTCTQVTTGNFLTFTGHHAGGHEYDGVKAAFYGTDAGKWTIHSNEAAFIGTNVGKFQLNPHDVIMVGSDTGAGTQIGASVSGAANNGSGLCRLTVSSTTGMASNDTAVVTGIAGATACNGVYTALTIVDGTHLDLTGSTFSGTYTSGGTVQDFPSVRLTGVTVVGAEAFSSTALRSVGRLVAVGSNTFTSLTTGADDTTIGHNSAGSLTTGNQNFCGGSGACPTLATGSGNVILGFKADVNTAGASNAIIIGGWNGGLQRGAAGTDGSTIIGGQAGSPTMTGTGNTCVGIVACQTLTSGANNLVLAGGGGPCNPLTATTSNSITICSGTTTAALVITGANVPATSVTTIAGELLLGSAKPTIASGFGTGAAVTGGNGYLAFSVAVGTSSANTGVLTMPFTAPNGWSCSVTNTSNPTSSVFYSKQLLPISTTQVTVGNFSNAPAAVAWSNNDVLTFLCNPY